MVKLSLVKKGKLWNRNSTLKQYLKMYSRWWYTVYSFTSPLQSQIRENVLNTLHNRWVSSSLDHHNLSLQLSLLYFRVFSFSRVYNILLYEKLNIIFNFLINYFSLFFIIPTASRPAALTRIPEYFFFVIVIVICHNI